MYQVGLLAFACGIARMNFNHLVDVVLVTVYVVGLGVECRGSRLCRVVYYLAWIKLASRESVV